MPTHREESARRIVIAEEFIGDMLPLTQQEMDRQVHLRDGAHVRGGVYGGDVFIEGNVTVDGPICSRTSVRFAPGPDAKITVNGGVKATHSVVVEGSGPDPQVLIRGDVYAKQANLRGTRILGNLFSGGRVGLEDSIVIGFVFTRGDLFAARSSMVSFRARSAAFCAVTSPKTAHGHTRAAATSTPTILELIIRSPHPGRRTQSHHT